MARMVAWSVKSASGMFISPLTYSVCPHGPHLGARGPEATALVPVTRKGSYFPLGTFAGRPGGMTRRCENGSHDEDDVYAALCPCRDVLEVLAAKWSALVIGVLEPGPERFGVLQERLEGVSPKVLTRTLRLVEEYGFVTRTVFPAVPPRVEYELTDLGRGAAGPLAQLRDWVESHVDFTRPAGMPVWPVFAPS